MSGNVHHRIEGKNSLITPQCMCEMHLEYDRRIKQPLILEIYRRYQERLRSGNSMIL